MVRISRRPGRDRDLGQPRRHRGRWAVAAVLALAVLAVGAVLLGVALQSSPAPLALPAGAAAPVGQVDGVWRAGAGSVAGFRVRETILGVGNDITGRTGAVSGTATVSSGRLESAAFQVSLRSIGVGGGARQREFLQTLGAAAHPDAVVALSAPVPLPPAFTVGAAITVTARASFTLNGMTRPVTVTLTTRRDGGAIEAAGSLPVAFSAFGIQSPGGWGILGSLADHGIAEFLVVLRPSS